MKGVEVEKAWREASRYVNCIDDKDCDFENKIYLYSVLQVKLKLFLFNTKNSIISLECAFYTRISDDSPPRTQQYIYILLLSIF